MSLKQFNLTDAARKADDLAATCRTGQRPFLARMVVSFLSRAPATCTRRRGRQDVQDVARSRAERREARLLRWNGQVKGPGLASGPS